jgi:hypothetical protein
MKQSQLKIEINYINMSEHNTATLGVGQELE